MNTWRELIDGCMQCTSYGDSWSNVELCTLSESELDVSFYDGFGSAEGKPFLIWTKKFIYFPTEYDGAEGVDRLPRNPTDEFELRHI